MTKQNIANLLKPIAVLLTLGLTPFIAGALESDQYQPAMLDADDFEIDLKTGLRIYRGNVVLSQGSILLKCDQLTTYINDDGALDKAVCDGRPASFKQRPEGAEHDVIAVARSITMDQVKEMVTLDTQARVEQGGDVVTGSQITYDLVTEKVIASTGGTVVEPQAPDKKAVTSKPTKRPRLIIQPRKKKPE